MLTYAGLVRSSCMASQMVLGVHHSARPMSGRSAFLADSSSSREK